jgi:hypothetical protein
MVVATFQWGSCNIPVMVVATFQYRAHHKSQKVTLKWCELAALDYIRENSCNQLMNDCWKCLWNLKNKTSVSYKGILIGYILNNVNLIFQTRLQLIYWEDVTELIYACLKWTTQSNLKLKILVYSWSVQQETTLISWFYCKITLHVSDTVHTHHQECNNCLKDIHIGWIWTPFKWTLPQRSRPNITYVVAVAVNYS